MYAYKKYFYLRKAPLKSSQSYGLEQIEIAQKYVWYPEKEKYVSMSTSKRF